MPTFKEIVERHRMQVAFNREQEAIRAERERRDKIAQSMVGARPYLDVLAAQITPEEFERQLLGDPDGTRFQPVLIPLPEEAKEAFTTAMDKVTYGSYQMQKHFFELADLSGSPLRDVLADLIDQGFTFEVNDFVGFHLSIWYEPETVV